jgi:hypothetical protein
MNAPSPANAHYSAVVVGGGQAGFSASYWLTCAGLDHVVFEKKTAMHKWRDERWDAFCLVTPNWQCQLPGHAYDGPEPHGFMVKDQILDYLDRFREKIDTPVRGMSRSCRLRRPQSASRSRHRTVPARPTRCFSRRVFTASLTHRGRPNESRSRSSRSTPRTTAIRRLYRQARWWSWARASPARKSRRICISRAARFISSLATRRAALASIAAETSWTNCGTSANTRTRSPPTAWVTSGMTPTTT